MATVAAVLGLLLVLLGVVGLVSPSNLLAFVARWQSRGGLYVATLLRLVLGGALLLAAPQSQAPEFLRVVGVIAIVAGLATPLVGLRRFEALLRWWSGLPLGFVRAWSTVVLALGASIVWAVTA
jgi:hypothetical protein